MSNTLVIRPIQPGKPRRTIGTLSQDRRTVEDRIVERANGLPVVGHDLDYPDAYVIGPCRGEMRFWSTHWTHDGQRLDERQWDPEHVEIARRILDLGGTLVTPIQPRYDGPAHVGYEPNRWRGMFALQHYSSDAAWSLPRHLDPDVVERVLGPSWDRR